MGPTSPASIAITVITTRISMRVKPRSVRRDTQYLFDRCDLGLHLHPTIMLHGVHAFLRSEIAQASERLARGDGAIHGFRNHEQFENPDPPAETRAATMIAAAATDQLPLAFRLSGQEGHDLWIRTVPFAALRTDPPDQALRQHAVHSCGDLVGRD